MVQDKHIYIYTTKKHIYAYTNSLDEQRWIYMPKRGEQTIPLIIDIKIQRLKNKIKYSNCH